MVSHGNKNVNDVFSPTVKNTFINLEFFPTTPQRASKSVPASSRLNRQDFVGIGDGKLLALNMDSDASTDAQTDASTCSQCGVKTPMSFDNYCFEEASSSPASNGQPQEARSQSEWLAPPTAARSPLAKIARLPNSPSQSQNQSIRLSSRATAFQPQAVIEDPARQQYKRQFSEVLARAKNLMKASEHLAHVEICADAGGWSFILQAVGKADALETERLLTIAKEALLEASSKSKCVYLIGYCAPKPFVMQPQGFEATLGAMGSAQTACWHVFKKGFCRHGATCNKEHPACKVPVRVLVESAQFTSCPRFEMSFKQQVADLAMAVTATLRACSYADQVEAFVDPDRQGWKIEVTAKEELCQHKEYLAALAKNMLFNGTNDSTTLYIMGYAVNPFITKTDGFVTVLGGMQDESKACWDLYSKGICSRDCECRWEHPECLMPINVVFKPRSSLKSLDAALACLVRGGQRQIGRQ